MRDDRILIHSIVATPDGGDGEVKIRGRALPIDDSATRGRYCDAVVVLGWRPEEPYFHLFRVDVADVTFIRYERAGDQHIARWPQGTEFVRRATSPTSVGREEPTRDLFRPE
jgi:hypothetical protein